ncbi:hypothetical protein GCM10019059_42860 [Camelimonas fluminis]|uniref:J domain-containing protein n=1 Tax=Camelimonas fluminis TaxID=1576911 RepID=A0ABV7UN97_9HYPH|nr:hypothetical protein [Camelimonas fluminis]GHE79838.1 hypothetical protein GCM10019059_42860 [Camelimonas fluminis]
MRPAIHCALNLFANPGLVRRYQQEKLPPDVHQLLLVAVGHGGARTAPTVSTGGPSHLEEAASFFIEQILLDQQSDSFRVLGCAREASHEELRRNMALLMRWLHPDMRSPRYRSVLAREVFITRVTRAWNDLKSDERRIAYLHANPAIVRGGRTGSRHGGAAKRNKGHRVLSPARPITAPSRASGLMAILIRLSGMVRRKS